MLPCASSARCMVRGQPRGHAVGFHGRIGLHHGLGRLAKLQHDARRGVGPFGVAGSTGDGDGNGIPSGGAWVIA